MSKENDVAEVERLVIEARRKLGSAGSFRLRILLQMTEYELSLLRGTSKRGKPPTDKRLP